MAETMLSLNEGGDPPQDRSFITYSGHKPRVKINPQKIGRLFLALLSH
jgi:hypothetical protein